MRKKYLTEGADGLHTHQLLELLLFHSILRKDTNDTAHRLLNSADSLEKLLHSSPEKLAEVYGVGENTALLLSLCGDIAKRSEDEDSAAHKLDSPFRQMRYLFNWYRGKGKGTAAITLLDCRKKVIETVHLCTSKVKDPNDFIPIAVSAAKDASATFAILSHNHWGGQRAPSVEDLYIASSMKRALMLVDCGLLEHYIVTHDDVVPIGNRKKNTNRKESDIK